MLLLPLARPVAVDVQTADPVLVEAAVVIVVDPLRVDPPFPRFSCLHPDHETGIIGRGLHRSRLVPDSHLEDVSVPVQVFRGILVQGSIAIRVVWTHTAPHSVGIVEEVVGAVRIQLGHDVDGPGVHQVGDEGIAAVLPDQRIDVLQADLGPHHLSSVKIAVDPESRLLQRVPVALIGDLQDQQVPALKALADVVELRDPGIRVHDRV